MDDFACQHTACAQAVRERTALGVAIEETSCEEVARGSRIHHVGYGFGRSLRKILARAGHRTFLAHLDNGNAAEARQFVEGFARLLAREGTGLFLVGKHDVGVRKEIAEKFALGLHDVVTGQVQTDGQARTLGQFDGARDKVVVEDQIALNVQIAVALHHLGAQVVGRHRSSRAQIGGKGAFAIGRDKRGGHTRAQFAGQQLGLNAIGRATVGEEAAVVVVRNLAYQTRSCSHLGKGQHRVAGRTARGALHLHAGKPLAQSFVEIRVNQLHRTFR